MSASLQSQKAPLPPIFKHTSRKWKELSIEGKSVAINDPTLKVGYLGDLNKKTKIELEELISRQDKLLSNADFISKLKDGGQRLRGRREELQLYLDKLEANNHKDSALPSIPDINALEWQWRSGSPSICEQREHAEPLDSDDDECPNPLHLLATHSMIAPPRMVGASSHSHGGMQDDIDPSESIREELRKLDIHDEMVQENMLNSTSQKTSIEANELDSDMAKDFGSKMLISLEKKTEDKSSKVKEVFKPFRSKNKQKLLTSTVIKFSSSSDTQTPLGTSHSNVTATTTTAITPSDAANPSFGVSVPPTFTSLNPVNVTGPKARRSALWACESAATGPLDAGAGRSVQLIPLRESVNLERQANERLRELQLQRAMGNSLASGRQTTNKRNAIYAYKDKNAIDMFLNNGDSDDELVEDLLSTKMMDQDSSIDESSEEEED